MRLLTILLTVFSISGAHAADKMKMYFNNEDILKIIEIYSKASGQKFVVDPGVRGKVSIFLQDSVTIEEGFNQLSSALAINGFAISKQGDTMIVKSARNIQRDLIEVSPEKPALKPERMYTWVYTAKNISVEQVNRDIRILSSRDGEMSVLPSSNQIMLTDWTSNLNRVAEVLKELDKPADPAAAKFAGAKFRKKEQIVKKEDKPEKVEKTEN